MKKRSISIVLIVILMLSMPLTVSANALKNETATLSGIVMSKDDFKNKFASSQKVSIDKNSFIECSLEMSDIVLSQNALSLKATLYSSAGINTSFVISGDLYSGYKNQIMEMNSVIVDADSSNDDVSILLFEMMFEDGTSVAEELSALGSASDILKTYNSSYFVSSPVVAATSIRLYLEIDNMIFMFEDDLPAMFESCDREYMQISDPTKDMLWFSKVITPTIKLEKESEAEIMTANVRSSDAGSNLWSGGGGYSISFDINGSTYVQRSVPFGYYRICDVTTNNASWKAEFYVSESTFVNGEKVSGVDNLIRYRNVQINMAVGKDTEFASSQLGGRILERGDHDGVVAGILSATVDWWDLGMSIVNVFSALTDTGQTRSLGSEFSDVYTSGTTAIGTKIPYSRGELYNNSYSSASSSLVSITSTSHYLILQANVHSSLSSSVTSVSTTGGVEFIWDAFLDSTLEDIATGEKKTFTKAYTNSH